MSIIILLSISVVSAADNETENALGVTDQQILRADSPGTFEELANDIQGSGIIELSRNYTYNGGNDPFLIEIDHSVTINGVGNIVLDANGAAGIFNITANDVILNNITFVNATQHAVYVGGNNCEINNSIFYNNSIDQYNSGAAIYWAGERGTVSNSYFYNNAVKSDDDDKMDLGGAIFWAGNYGTVRYCNFTNNKARNGGAISWGYYGENKTTGDYYKLMPEYGVVDHCNFDNNTAYYHGASILACGPYFTIKESNFTNSTGVFSAVLITTPAHDSNISYCNFEDNTAIFHDYFKMGNYVGSAALEVDGFSTTIEYCNFTNNNAYGGYYWYWDGVDWVQGDVSSFSGAVKVDGNAEDTVMDNCNFDDNTAQTYGAVEWLAINGIIKYSNFTNNKATDGQAGAVQWSGSAEHGTVMESKFIDNNAAYTGGAIYWEAIDGKVLNSNFTHNTVDYDSGGAIYWNGEQGKVSTCIFFNNTADYYGGAIDWEESNGIVDNHCIFFNNSAFDSGAICWAGDNGIIADYCIFTNNTAEFGGAISWYGEKGNITNNCNFTSNSADENGGAIFWDGSEGSISDNCLFIYNNATDFGGAIYWSGDDAYIGQNCNFTNNTANNGGAICMDGQYSTIEDNCYFNNNTAYENGGAIQWTSNDGTLDNCCYFINNTANQGGAIRIDGENVVIKDNCIFINNTADDQGGAIKVEGANSNITDTCSFINNSAINGGAIYYYLQGGKGYLSNNCIFFNNSADEKGGAIRTESATITINDNCRFSNNTADSQGGAIFFGEGESSVSDSYFTSNSANEGGAIYIEYATDVSGSDFTDNTATNIGGAIVIGDDGSKITSSNFTSNSANNGGAIYCGVDYGGTIYGSADITYADFKDNNASENGGAIVIGCDGSQITSSNFTSNSAKNGGAIFSGVDYGGTIYGSAAITYANFKDNNASENGGAIYYWAEDQELNNANFTGNTAIYGGAIYGDANNINIDVAYFNNNNATNGSAIYKTSNANNFKIANTVFERNQAHSKEITIEIEGNKTYALATVTVKISLIANDNIANAIWNDGGLNTIKLKNINCEFSIDSKGRSPKSFNTNDYAEPTNGFVDKNSIWQSPYEDAQLIDILIKRNNTVIYNITDGNIKNNNKNGVLRALPDDTGLTVTKTDGSITVQFVNNLEAGTYTVDAVHNEDAYYKAVKNKNSFVIYDVNLAINKTANVTKVANNTLVNYTITVNANGSGNASNVIINDTLPDNLTYGNWGIVKDNGATIVESGIAITNGVSLNVSNITSGSYVSVWITATVNTDKLGNITNVVTTNCDGNKTVVSNSTDVEVVPVVLTINKTANVTKVSNGNLVNYTITVKNIGLGNASNVIIKDVLPENMTFRQQNWGIVESNGASINTHGVIIDNGISLKVSNITSGSYVSIWITATVKITNHEGNITNVVTTNCDENKTVVSNSTNVTVVPVVLIINKIANVTKVVNNSLINYTITVKNIGEGNASYSIIKDKLPANLTYVNWGIVKSNGAIISVDTISIDDVVLIASNITSGNYISVWVTATVKTDKLGNITNVVTTACIENSTEVSNSTNVTVVPVVLTVNKTANVTWVANTNVVNFTIVVNNTALVNVTDVVVVDQLPANLTYVDGGVIDANGAGVTKVDLNNGVQWTVSFMESNAIVRFWITAIVDTQQVGNITNSVNVTCKENDTEVKNSTNVTVVPVVLNINKTVDVSPVANNTLVNFTVTVSNVDLGNATDVVVVDELPVGLSFVDAGVVSDPNKVVTYLGQYGNGAKWNISKLNSKIVDFCSC